MMLWRRPFGLVCFLLLVAFSSRAQTGLVNHWETVVYDSNVWKYFPGTSDPGATWTQSDYDDSSWANGRESVGYGDGDDRTIISPVLSVFLRKKFTIKDISKIAAVIVNVDFDDGFIAYFNGVEIARANMGTGTPAYDQTTPTDHEALLYQGLVPDHFNVDNELLLPGENIITLEVHNVNFTSSDLTSALFLSVGISDNSATYGKTPKWFVPPISLNLQSSNLPIIIIGSNHQLITSATKITGFMGMTDNGPGQRNGFHDPYNAYHGQVSIEVHGESSTMFPKKSYRIETQDDSGNNLNVSLGGMPAENDWILYAPYSDKSMLRNMVAYKLGRSLNRFYAPRSIFVELVVNDEYQGIYMLVEKIKVDKNRVNVSKLKTTDITGDDLTGGYLLRVDKIDAGNYPAWTPAPSPRLAGESDVTFQYYDPKGEDLTDGQRTYIQNYVTQFESTLSSSSFADPVNGYKHFINAASFVDFMMIEELSKNVDAYVYSTYLYKDKDSKGGKLTMGPLWDFDLAFGNVNYNTDSEAAPGWTYSESYRMFWFRRLMSAPAFADSMQCRWTALRKDKFDFTRISALIDSGATVLTEASARNFQQWPILGTYVWPNQYIGATWQNEINFLKTWIANRLAWVDQNLPGTCGGTVNPVTGLELPALDASRISLFPNPTSGSFSIQFQQPPEKGTLIAIYNSVGQRVSEQEVIVQQDLIWQSDAQHVQLPAVGFYVVEVRAANGGLFRGKLLKR